MRLAVRNLEIGKDAAPLHSICHAAFPHPRPLRKWQSV
jgi:hypothetical protein